MTQINADKKKRLIFVITMFLIVSLTGFLFAKDVNFEVTIDKNKVSLGSSLKLNLTFHGIQDVSAPELPDIDGFNWRYLGPSTRMSIVNGKVSSSITHMYTLVPLKVGTFQIPSFSVQYKDEAYTSDPIPIEVVQGPVSQPLQGQQSPSQDSAQDLEDRIFLVMQVDKERSYVNEIIPLTIKLYINNLAIRDIQYPEFAHDGFSVDKFTEPKQYREVLNGISHDVIEFNTVVFGMRPGELRLGPAELKCNLIVKKESRRRPRSSFFDDDFFGSDIFDDFFGRYETYPLSLRSIDIPVTIVGLPEEGKPDDFNGSLGNYRFSLEAEPREVKLGDPITLKMIVSGEGNFKTVNPPAINFKDDFKIYDPEVKQDQKTKLFEQVIIPKNDKINEIPEISFSFFDSRSGKYKKITKGPIPIKVNPLPKGEELKVFEISEGTDAFRKREILGRDIIYIKDTPGRLKRKGEILCKNRLFIAVQFIPLLLIIFVLVFQRRKERLETDISYARRLRAPRKAKKNLLKVRWLVDSKQPDKFFDAVFKMLQEYLGDKFHLATRGITSDVAEELGSRNIDKGIIDRLKECFNNCDRARYAPSSITKDQIHKTFKLLEEIIDGLERARI